MRGNMVLQKQTEESITPVDLMQKVETLEKEERDALLEAIGALEPYCKDFNSQMSVLGFKVVPSNALLVAKVATAGAQIRVLAEGMDPETGKTILGRYDALCQGNDGRLFWLSAITGPGLPKVELKLENLESEAGKIRIRAYTEEVVRAVPASELEKHLLMATDALVNFVHALETSLGMELTPFE